MADQLAEVVLFDIGNTLGAAQLSPPPVRLQAIIVFPYVTGVLESLAQQGVRLGIISNTGNELAADMQRVLSEAGLYDFFEENLLIYSSEVGLVKDSPEIFELAAEKAGLADGVGKCVFVGEDSSERVFAAEAGMRVCPHPLLAEAVAGGEPLVFLSATPPPTESVESWSQVIGDRPFVSLGAAGGDSRKQFAIAPRSTAAELINALFEVTILGGKNLPGVADLYLLRDDRANQTGFMSPGGQAASLLKGEAADWLLGSTRGGMLVAVPGGKTVEGLHFEQAQHGHNLKLTPSPQLLSPFGRDSGARGGGFLEAPLAFDGAAAAASLSDNERETLSEITGVELKALLDRYSGISPLGDDGDAVIKSRHIHHTDNARATAQLAVDLQETGGDDFEVRLWSFTHEGQTLYNVEAEYRGDSEETVLVTAHFDSTAAFSSPFSSASDIAPGADDDGSGTAGVLAAARRLKKLCGGGKPGRTVRFVLFNAEEHGLIGSRAFAAQIAAADTPVIAVYQMDMIGYNVDDPRSFEVHAGFLPSEDVQQRSLALAERVKQLQPLVSPELEPPQIYVSSGPGQVDPAEGRSDHASFQEHGYAACIVSEDFFAGPSATDPAPESNPNYHRKEDTYVDFDYAASITRLITAAVWTLARPAPAT